MNLDNTYSGLQRVRFNMDPWKRSRRACVPCDWLLCDKIMDNEGY